jgi:DNA-binding response OmpR family regulator
MGRSAAAATFSGATEEAVLAVRHLLDELEERSLVERVRHPQDRRALLIHLTAAGRDVQRRAAAALAGAADTLLSPLDPAERVHLVDLLAKVAAHWQQVSAGQQDPAAGPLRPAAGRSRPASGQARPRPAGASTAAPATRRGTRTPADPYMP